MSDRGKKLPRIYETKTYKKQLNTEQLATAVHKSVLYGVDTSVGRRYWREKQDVHIDQSHMHTVYKCSSYFVWILLLLLSKIMLCNQGYERRWCWSTVGCYENKAPLLHDTVPTGWREGISSVEVGDETQHAGGAVHFLCALRRRLLVDKNQYCRSVSGYISWCGILSLCVACENSSTFSRENSSTFSFLLALEQPRWAP